MILVYELVRDGEAWGVLSFVEGLQAKVREVGIVTNVVFSKRRLKVFLEKDRVFLVYWLVPSLPPVYLAGWLLALFFVFLGWSWWVWIWPALFGLTGVFYSKPWFNLLFKVSLHKAGVVGRAVGLSYFVGEVVFKDGAD